VAFLGGGFGCVDGVEKGKLSSSSNLSEGAIFLDFSEEEEVTGGRFRIGLRLRTMRCGRMFVRPLEDSFLEEDGGVTFWVSEDVLVEVGVVVNKGLMHACDGAM